MIIDPINPSAAKTIMTNSGKYAHYGPGLTGRRFYFGSMSAQLATASITRIFPVGYGIERSYRGESARDPGELRGTITRVRYKMPSPSPTEAGFVVWRVGCVNAGSGIRLDSAKRTGI